MVVHFDKKTSLKTIIDCTSFATNNWIRNKECRGVASWNLKFLRQSIPIHGHPAWKMIDVGCHTNRVWPNRSKSTNHNDSTLGMFQHLRRIQPKREVWSHAPKQCSKIQNFRWAQRPERWCGAEKWRVISSSNNNVLVSCNSVIQNTETCSFPGIY